jgi:hypothetical protein
MSGKIKAKDLSYDSTLPPFLQKLHAKNAGRGDTDRHERQLARPQKPREVDPEDGPTVVDEHGDVLSKDDVENLGCRASDATRATDANENPPLQQASHVTDSKPVARPNITDAFAPKKRKMAKAIGEVSKRNNDSADNDEKESKSTKKQKKARKPKLAFEDDAGE